jgi:DNA-binding HxlR family transcriptional regulator
MVISFEAMDCSVAQAAALIGDKWTLVLLRNAFQGMTRFDEFSEHLGVSSNILADRLAKLVANDIIYQRKVPGDGRAFEYKLSPKGYDLFPLIVFLNQWGERWMGNAEGPHIEIIEKNGRAPIRPVQVQAEDGRVLTANETLFRSGAGGSSVLEKSVAIISRRRQPRTF